MLPAMSVSTERLLLDTSLDYLATDKRGLRLDQKAGDDGLYGSVVVSIDASFGLSLTEKAPKGAQTNLETARHYSCHPPQSSSSEGHVAELTQTLPNYMDGDYFIVKRHNFISRS